MLTPNVKPTLSIVTICLNAEKHILDTLNSVAVQLDLEFEYVVIDGGSSDNTVGIVERFKKGLIDCFISEEDHGIADALNKGLAASSGEYVVFLHADDYFIDEHSTAKIKNAVLGGQDIVAFNIARRSERETTIRKPRGFGLYTYIKMPFYHPGTVCRRALFERLGGFDTRFRIAMDYDFFLRAYLEGSSSVLVDDQFVVFRETGVSSRTDWSSTRRRLGEEREVQRKNTTSLPIRMAQVLWWSLYPMYKRVIAS